MFTKKVPVRRTNIQATQYRKVIDWEAVGGAAFIVFIVLALIGSCAG